VVKDLLFLVHRIPYPPNKGDKIRSFNWLKHLSKAYRVHLGCFIDDEDDWRHLDTVKAHCEDVHAVALNSRSARLRSLRGLFSGRPLSLPYYAHAGLQRWVTGRLDHGMDAVLVFSGAMAQFLPPRLPSGLRSVCDFVDIDSDKWLQYADGKRWPMSWVYRREGRCLLEWERKVAWHTDASLFVSESEARMFRELAPEVAERILHVENGVDTDYFSPEHEFPSPYADGGKNIVFTGAMDYWPNIDAVTWFAAEVMPKLRRHLPGIRFRIVGSRPAAQVSRLAAAADIDVVGAVHDMRPWLAHADVAVAPLRIARGVQNKVLEAMSMAKAVVVSQEGLDGIEAHPGEHLELGSDAAAFASAVIESLDPEQAASLGRNARKLVQQRYAWQYNLDRLQRLLQGESLEIESATEAA